MGFPRLEKNILICRWSFILLFLIACWFGMEAVHELGHALAAWCSGAMVERVVLLPISRTDTAGVEHPLFVYGAGAVFGEVFPVLLWSIILPFRFRFAYLFRFFAGFCLIANGAYIGCDFSTVGPTDIPIDVARHGIVPMKSGIFGIGSGHPKGIAQFTLVDGSVHAETSETLSRDLLPELFRKGGTATYPWR